MLKDAYIYIQKHIAIPSTNKKQCRQANKKLPNKMRNVNN